MNLKLLRKTFQVILVLPSIFRFCKAIIAKVEVDLTCAVGRIQSFEESITTTEGDWKTLNKTATSIAAKKGRKSEAHKDKGKPITAHGPTAALNAVLKMS
jgi:hypothetical protein